MAHAYTPGLLVSPATLVRKARILPMRGQVLVQPGQLVEAHTTVARAELPGDVHPVNVANRLGIQSSEIGSYMLKKPGDAVQAGQPIAATRPWIKLLRVVCLSPAAGTIQSISDVTGQVMVQEPPRLLELPAYVRGRVVDVIPQEGAVVETRAALVQGIFGIGGERTGPLLMAADGPDRALSAADVGASWKGAVVVVGSTVTAELARAAVRQGTAALIGGAIAARELHGILGYELGVAVTGSEQVGLTVIVTEGFGRMAMAANTFSLLKSLEGRMASVNGATQIRAGVRRPEIVVPLDEAGPEARGGPESAEADGLNAGDPVRLIREPYFGLIGRVARLVPDLQTIETEARVRAMQVQLEDGRTVTVPRANVEIIKA
jgi:hypothetical protein